MIQFINACKRYSSGFDALKNVNFHMAAGEMAFLTGHSGAGKSSLLKLIALLERSSRGQVIVNNQNLAKVPRRGIPYFRRNIGIIFQDHQLLFDRTVYDNVALPLIIAGFSHRDIGKRVRAALDKVGLLNKEKKYPVTLSGGEQQRVGIARAVVNKPPLILADEPTGNLDPELSTEIMNLFRDFSDVGVTVLVATHDLALISQLPYRMLTLKAGKLINDSDPHE
jgi:cell division transport system ATP-binding protein